jgi:hypothetical protein
MDAMKRTVDLGSPGIELRNVVRFEKQRPNPPFTQYQKQIHTAKIKARMEVQGGGERWLPSETLKYAAHELVDVVPQHFDIVTLQGQTTKKCLKREVVEREPAPFAI